jgi:apolipoprotein N-acyltransferase
VALVPLLLAIQGIGWRRAALLGLTVGVVHAALAYRWMFQVPGFALHHAAILGLYLGLYPAAWAAGVAAFRRRGRPILVLGPALWVALDYARSHAGFLAVSWGTLAHTQHRDLPLLQVAALAGEYGVTFLVVLGNLAVAECLTRRTWRPALWPGAAVALAHLGGALALQEPATPARVRVAVVQPSITVEARETTEGWAASLERLERLTRLAAAARPTAIVWPETAVRALIRDPDLAARVQALARETDTPLVVGSSDFLKLRRVGNEPPIGIRAYNMAYLVTPSRELGEPYHKILLVPFGEYQPIASVVRWPTWLVPQAMEGVPGEMRRPLVLPDGTSLAPLICWENLFGDFVRTWVRDGARLVVQLTNDAWFGESAAPRQHNLASVLRAVENRTPVAIASNTGPSQIIDPFGRVVAEIPGLFVDGVVWADVALGTGGTPYTRSGDVFTLAMTAGLAFAILASALGWVRP